MMCQILCCYFAEYLIMRNVLSVFSFYTEEKRRLQERLRALPRLTQLCQSEPGLNWKGLSGLENQPVPLQGFFCTVIPPEDTGHMASLKTVPFLVYSRNWYSPGVRTTKEKETKTQSCLEFSQGQTRKAEIGAQE